MNIVAQNYDLGLPGKISYTFHLSHYDIIFY